MKLSILVLVFSTVVASDNQILKVEKGKRAKGQTHTKGKRAKSETHTNLDPEDVRKKGKRAKSEIHTKGKRAKSETHTKGKKSKSETHTKGKKSKSKTHTNLDPEDVRSVLRTFKESLDNDSDLLPMHRQRGYHQNATDQIPDYHFCTFVQQCLDPYFILSLGLMSTKSRSLVYKALSLSMSYESFNMLQLQQHSNMLLGEMQDWATTCEGECRELHDQHGSLDPVGNGNLLHVSKLVLGDKDYNQCGNLRNETESIFWYCNEEPRMIHQANINVTTGEYKLGNIWREPHIHGRNSHYDYFSVYGDMNDGGAFGFRFTGHHIDLNYMWNNDGVLIKYLPVFLGHNPLIVPATTPLSERHHNEGAKPDQFYDPIMWNNMAGVAQFAESVRLVVDCANELLISAPDSFVPLDKWESAGHMGGLKFPENKNITDFPFVDFNDISDDSFSLYWSMVEYTLKFARGNESTDYEREVFRSQGKAVWTTSSPGKRKGLPLTEEDLRSNINFFNLRIETNEMIFYVMVNQLFTVISETEPTNHLHSILVYRDLIRPENFCMKHDDPDDPLCFQAPWVDLPQETPEPPLCVCPPTEASTKERPHETPQPSTRLC